MRRKVLDDYDDDVDIEKELMVLNRKRKSGENRYPRWQILFQGEEVIELGKCQSGVICFALNKISKHPRSMGIIVRRSLNKKMVEYDWQNGLRGIDKKKIEERQVDIIIQLLNFSLSELKLYEVKEYLYGIKYVGGALSLLGERRKTSQATAENIAMNRAKVFKKTVELWRKKKNDTTDEFICAYNKNGQREDITQ